MLGQAQLERIRFPIGEIDKGETRRIAADLGLRTAGKSESMDICFVAGGDYRSFLASVAPESQKPGDIVDADGTVLGRHAGVASVTIGQRRGLGVALGEPRYVVDVDPGSATVVVGPRQDLAVSGIELVDQTWVSEPVRLNEAVLVQYRAHGEAVPAILRVGGVDFEEPQLAVAPGQTVAFYDGDEVLGSAVISSTVKRASD
jgi:tRNA-specific 2-thiouridylase